MDFESFLMEQCMLENPTILDDDSVEFYENWICDLDIDDLIKYANKYGKEIRDNELG